MAPSRIWNLGSETGENGWWLSLSQQSTDDNLSDASPHHFQVRGVATVRWIPDKNHRRHNKFLSVYPCSFLVWSNLFWSLFFKAVVAFLTLFLQCRIINFWTLISQFRIIDLWTLFSQCNVMDFERYFYTVI